MEKVTTKAEVLNAFPDILITRFFFHLKLLLNYGIIILQSLQWLLSNFFHINKIRQMLSAIVKHFPTSVHSDKNRHIQGKTTAL